MSKIKKGDVFLFPIDDKYGLIQVIGKGKIAGYNVRVFNKLIDNTNKETIDNALNSIEYYFIKDFYTYDLLSKSSHQISYKMVNKIIIPRFMRTCETNTNDNIVWYVIDTKTGKVVKEYKEYSPELDDLSPSETWGIEYISKRWKESFTLKEWNNFQHKWLLEYKNNTKINNHFIKASVTKLIDDSTYPEVVLLEFYDINNKKHEVIEKWPVISNLKFSNEFPKECLIACMIIEEKENLYIVSTLEPWSIESTSGLTVFEISKTLIINNC